MSLLTIVQDACRGLALPVPTGIIASTDPSVQQLRRLADQEGRDLLHTHTWRKLVKEQTFTTTATEVQSNVLPSDFDRFFNETVFNRTNTRRVLGPLTPHEWQAEKAILASVLYDAFRLRGNDFIVTPVPAAGETWAFEYVSKWWVDTDSDDVGEADGFASDTDEPLFSEELMTLGLTWRFRQAKGLDYAEPFRSYQIVLADDIARDGGRRTLDMKGSHPQGARIPYVSEGDWPL